MSRLAVGLEPPSGFWEKTQKLYQTVQNQMEDMQFQSTKTQYNVHVSKTLKTTPLTWIPC